MVKLRTALLKAILGMLGIFPDGQLYIKVNWTVNFKTDMFCWLLLLTERWNPLSATVNVTVIFRRCK